MALGVMYTHAKCLRCGQIGHVHTDRSCPLAFQVIERDKIDIARRDPLPKSATIVQSLDTGKHIVLKPIQLDKPIGLASQNEELNQLLPDEEDDINTAQSNNPDCSNANGTRGKANDALGALLFDYAPEDLLFLAELDPIAVKLLIRRVRASRRGPKDSSSEDSDSSSSASDDSSRGARSPSDDRISKQEMKDGMSRHEDKVDRSISPANKVWRASGRSRSTRSRSRSRTRYDSRGRSRSRSRSDSRSHVRDISTSSRRSDHRNRHHSERDGRGLSLDRIKREERRG